MAFSETPPLSIQERQGTLVIPEELGGRKGEIYSPDKTRRLWFSFGAPRKSDGQEKAIRQAQVFLFAKRLEGEKYVLLRGLSIVELTNGERTIIISVESLKEEKNGEQIFYRGEYHLDNNSLFLAGSFTPEIGTKVTSREWENLGFVPKDELPEKIDVEATAAEIMGLVQTQPGRESLEEHLSVPELLLA